ncbi:hypothetical protein WJX72_011905 [[Myrmecia] bisecta]|uniref:Protein YIP n=1 Tax=[Myrmecia] bisecta TaxID=41462 RepID=A0AAW1PU06_9CHLO
MTTRLPPVLQFQDSHLPTHSTTGKMGAAEVPRVQPYSGNQPLLQATHPPLSAPSPDADGENGTKYSMFNLKRYRKYFNVDTEDVLSRMLDSVVGFFRADFLEKTTDSADLYGPFWIATTLVFVGAVTGNYANYVSYKAKHSQQPDAELPTWYYNVDKVGYSAALFYGYVGVIGLLLFASLKWLFKSTVSLAQVWCTYGYSLSLFIPISFFCIFPYEVARWVLVMAATLTSGLFLMLNFRQPIFDVAGAKALPVWLLQGVLHLGLGLVLKLYFFQYW